jgi:hypothetical protein
MRSARPGLSALGVGNDSKLRKRAAKLLKSFAGVNLCAGPLKRVVDSGMAPHAMKSLKTDPAIHRLAVAGKENRPDEFRMISRLRSRDPSAP